jgi:acetoin:2,6-dichlorophenolindophenol oxidoreductase subunit beta
MPDAGTGVRVVTYVEAISAALAQEMRRDPRVYMLGEDVTLGGPFGATRGLAEEFGERRVVNTPISEATVVGLAVGVAVLGYRPVVEIMFMDFMTLAMDQLVNQAAKYRYMSGGQFAVPMVVRALLGVMGSFGAQHSQSLEGWLLGVPGLKVVAPSTPADVGGLLAGAIRDDNPVIVLEHRGLYTTRGAVRGGEQLVPLGSAVVRRTGRHVTLLAYSGMVRTALDAAAVLAERGVETEVIDLRSLAPLDVETATRSIGKTHRALVLSEAVGHGGVAAIIAAALQQAVFDELDAPISWVAAPFSPVPASPALEAAYVPRVAQVVGAVDGLLG